MNQQQERWWLQARSDLEVLVLLRQRGAVACHQLHYLQMVAEKIGKAYFWGKLQGPPPKSHAGFVKFLRFLGSVRPPQQARIAEVMEFGRFDDFESWLPTVCRWHTNWSGWHRTLPETVQIASIHGLTRSRSTFQPPINSTCGMNS